MPYKDPKKRYEAVQKSRSKKPELYAKLDKAKELARSQRGYHTARNYRIKYGLTIEEYAWMCHRQDWMCALCCKPPGKRGLVVDHCHATGKIRQLLCDFCNKALGVVENRSWMKLAEVYLANHS